MEKRLVTDDGMRESKQTDDKRERRNGGEEVYRSCYTLQDLSLFFSKLFVTNQLRSIFTYSHLQSTLKD